MKKWICTGIVLFLPLFVSAQSSDFEQGVRNYQNGSFDLAITRFESAIKTNPSHIESHLFLALSYLEENFPILAENTALEASKRFADEGGFLWIAGEALLMQNQPDEASGYFRQLFRYFEDFTFSASLNITESKIRDRWIDTELYKSSLAYQNRDFESAVESLDTVLRLRPDQPDALKNRIYIFMEQGEWEMALTHIEEAEEVLPEDQDIIRMKANIYYNMENMESLLREYRELYSRNEGDKEIAFTYADILIANQKGSEAELVITDMIEQYPDDKDVYWKLAEVQEQRMYIREKAAALQWLLENFPGDTEALAELASAYELLEEYSKQRDTLRELLESSGDELSIHINITDSYLKENQLPEAESYLEQIRDGFPGNETLLILLGDVMQKRGKWEKSIEVYEEVESGQLLRKAGTQIGHAYFQIGEKSRSFEILQEVTNSGVDDALAWQLMAEMKIGSNTDDAHLFGLRALESGIQEMAQIQKITLEALNKEGMFASIDEREEQYDYYDDIVSRTMQFLNKHFSPAQVVQDLRNIVDAYDDSSTLHFYVAQLLFDQGNMEEAKTHATRALEINPQFYDAHILYGQIQKKSNNFRDASLSFDRARSILPETPEAYREMIDLYQSENRLSDLTSRWEIQYRAESKNKLFKEFLIEAYQRNDQFGKAQELVND